MKKIFSEEHKRKLSKSHKGKIGFWRGKKRPPHSEEAKRKLSEAHKGLNTWSKGCKLTEEHKRKLSETNKGRIHSEEHNRKVGEGHRGKKVSEEAKAKMSKAKKGKIPWNKGKTGIWSREALEKMSEQRKGRMVGSGHPQWKGGVTPINTKIRHSLEYRLWRTAVFERDNFTCIWCGQKGGRLNADHIKPFALFPELRFAIDNGRTLCEPCHRTTDTFGSRTKIIN